jgi:hypothetical protein
MKMQYPNLDEFLGGYFHQDWRDDAATANGIVQKYLGEWPIEGIREASNELRRMLESLPAEAELASTAQGLGCYYNPEGDGLTYAAWLMNVCQQLEAAA